jgi:hypothetical protein
MKGYFALAIQFLRRFLIFRLSFQLSLSPVVITPNRTTTGFEFPHRKKLLGGT